MDNEISNSRIIARLIIWFGGIGALLFGTAGTLKWPAAWIYLSIFIAGTIANTVWMVKNSPQLLKDRMGFDKKKPQPGDKVVLFFFYTNTVILVLLPGLDVVRFGWSSLPFFTRVIGFLLLIGSDIVLFLVIRENPHLSRAVEVYQDREHQVITTGPYQYIRHPWYLGLLLFFYGTPLALGSVYTLIPAGILNIVLIFRILMEDKAMCNDLPGYREYYEKLKYRVIPYVW